VQRSRGGTQGQRDLPALHTTRLVQRPQNVVERHEERRALVDNRHADHGTARAPAPFDDAILGVQAVHVFVLRSHEEAIVADEDVVGRTAEAPLPAGRARIHSQRDDARVAPGEVEVFAGKRGLRMSGRPEIAAPDQHAVRATKGEDVAAGRED